MKGYSVHNGYMGYVLGEGYRLFESEDAYYEWHIEANPETYSYSEGGL